MAESKTRTDRASTLYLVDISSFIFRAFFAIRSLTNRAGEPTNAIYGVATMLARLMEEAQPERLAVVYDSKEPSVRKEIYKEYKANRSAPPDDLVPQFDKIEELVSCLGMHSYRRSGVEADDIIGTLTRKWCEASPKNRVVVVTGDKDLMQLVCDRVTVWDTMNNAHYGPAEVEVKFGVKPGQIRDYLALIGDSSDNIPGVPSIGPKTAVTLLQEYGDLESVLKAAADGKITGKKGEVLKTHVDDARLSARLASLDMNLPDEPDAEHTVYQFSISDRCIDFLRLQDFHTLITKWAKYSGGSNGTPKTVSDAPFETRSEENSEESRGAGTTPGSKAAGSRESAHSGAHGRAPAEDENKGGSGHQQQSLGLITQLSASPDQFRTINTEKDFKKLLEAMEKSGEFGFDLETTSLNPRQAELVGIAISHDPSFGAYIPVGHRGTHVPQLPEKQVMEALKPFIESAKYKKIGQNLKYDWSVLLSQGLKPSGISADTMVAAYVLEPADRHNLEVLAAQHLGYAVTTYEQICGKGKDQIGFDQVPIDVATRYSGEDAWIAVRLWDVLRPKIQAEGLMDIFKRVDLPLVDILARMECQGVCIDEPWLRQLSKEFEKDLKSIEERIQAFTKAPINLNSPKQLGQLLFEDLKLPVQSKTKTGFSTDAKVLEALAPLHEVPRLLLEYREISKLKGTYVDTLPQMRDAKTGKIHAGFHQTVAATGRLSSSDPNLQNIPIRSERGRKIRRAFVAGQGNVLVSADYSQIELRLLAHMSGDKELTSSFIKGEDVHQRTASEIFAVKPEEVTERQRGIAKAINFGLMYGKTAFGLAQELKIPRREAQDIINRYFERYNGVKRFLDNQIIEAKEKGFIATVLGRKRNLPDIRSSNQAIRNNAERMAMNSPIQGTAADLMKLAMIQLDEELTKGGYDSRLILQVHDEFVLDCPKKEAAEVRKLVERVMENAMKLSVPLSVNSATGDNWMEL